MGPQDEREWWARSPGFLRDHPLSIDSTIGLFPVTWCELIQEAYPGLAAWDKALRAECADPDNWLVIPDFDMVPEDVGYEGFDLLVGWDAGPHMWGLRSVIQTVRSLARQQFTSLADLHSRRLHGRRRQKEQQSAAADVYEAVIESLIGFVDRRLPSEDRVFRLGEAVSVLAEWVSSGPAAALQRSREGGSVGGRKGAEHRKRENKVQDKRLVISAARRLDWPNSTYGVLKALDGQFPIGYRRIQQILSEEKRRILQARGLLS